MCGLIGAFGAEGLAPGGLRASLDILAPRGPDAEQVWQDEAVVLGHRRLAIIDLDQRSAQPIVSACGRYVIAYNGEVYNYATIRDQLAAEGVRFRTDSDTEVILEGYIHRGAALFAQLHGMFVFVIWDCQRRRAVVARDPYGIKPLYIGTGRQGQVVIGSQVRAVLASGAIDPARDPSAAESFWLLGSVREPLTWYRDIRALPPGHMAEIKPERLTGIEQHFGMRNVVRTVTREEFEADLPRILASMDQLSIYGVNTSYASKVAAEAGQKAVMSGVGGDELFLGYGHFRTLRDSDWASMYHGLELRTPLVGAQLLMSLSPVMGDFAAHLNKSLLSDTLAKPLPHEILNHPKTGWMAGIMDLPDCDA